MATSGFKNQTKNRVMQSDVPMVNSRTPGQQINPLQRTQCLILETDVWDGIFGDGRGRRRGEGGVDVGVGDRRGTFGTIGRGGDEMRMIGHFEMGVVPGDLYAHIAGIV